MEYFGIEVHGAYCFTPFPLEENEPLEDQWFFLGSDVGTLRYEFRGYCFDLTTTWYGDKEDILHEKNVFVIRVIEGPRTLGKTFFNKNSKSDLKELKLLMKEGIDFIESIKKMSDDEISTLPGYPRDANWDD